MSVDVLTFDVADQITGGSTALAGQAVTIGQRVSVAMECDRCGRPMPWASAETTPLLCHDCESESTE